MTVFITFLFGSGTFFLKVSQLRRISKDFLLRRRIPADELHADIHSRKSKCYFGANVTGQCHSDLSFMDQRVRKMNGSHSWEAL